MNFEKRFLLFSLFCFFLLCDKAIGFESSNNPPNDLPQIPPDGNDTEYFESAPNPKLHRKLIEETMHFLLDRGLFHPESQQRRIPFQNPDKFFYELDTYLGEKNKTYEEVRLKLEQIILHSMKPADPFRLTRRVSGLDPLAVAGDWLATTMSNSVLTYLVAPIWTMMEIKMTEYLSKRIGWRQTGDGVSTSGAASANSMALAAAIQHKFPEVKDIGLAHFGDTLRHPGKPELYVYVSTHASMSWKTAMVYCGLGLNHLIEVPVNSRGGMDIIELKKLLLEKEKQKDKAVALVVATAGTPILGAIDRIDDIGNTCRHFGAYFHVDAELAGGYLFAGSQTGRGLVPKLREIFRADSVTVGTWLFQTPYTSTMLLTKHPQGLQRAFGLQKHDYTFADTDLYNYTYDRGDHTVQTSRRPEIAKMWFAAARGEREIATMFKLMDERAHSITTEIMTREGFKIVRAQLKGEPHYFNAPTERREYEVPLVSFAYIPKKLRRLEKTNPNKFNAELSAKMQYVKNRLLEKQMADVSLNRFPNDVMETEHSFLTIALTNTRFTKSMERELLDMVRDTAEEKETVLSSRSRIMKRKNCTSRRRRVKNERVMNPRRRDPNERNITLKYPNYPDKPIYYSFMKGVIDLILEKGLFFSRRNRTGRFKSPKQLESLFDFNLPYKKFDLDIMLEQFKSVIELSPKLAHPYFMYQLSAGLNPFTLLADYIVPVVNSPMISYYDSTFYVQMEQQVVRQMLLRVYGNGNGDGVITDGGSMANQMAIRLAFERFKNWEVKERGVASFDVGPRIYMSETAHNSFTKGAILEGIGQNNTIRIGTDKQGRMNFGKLKAQIKQDKKDGYRPLMVVLTTGTTIYGAIDYLDPIITYCKKEDIWVHIDAMLGGLVVLSDKYEPLFKGIERSDSWATSLHKLFGSSMVSSILLTSQNDSDFKNAFEVETGDYHKEEQYFYQSRSHLHWDNRHSQLDKRNNMFKFWLLWFALGREGLEAYVNKIMENKDNFIAELKKRKNSGFELVLDNFELTNVCFRYTPRWMREEEDPRWRVKDARLNHIAYAIEKEFLKYGLGNFVAQAQDTVSTGKTPKFLKFAMMGSTLRPRDWNYLLDTIAYFGDKVNHLDIMPFPMANQPFQPFGANRWYNAISD